MLPKLLLVLTFSVFFLPSADENIIEWDHSRKLTWADFKGKPDPNSTNAALTNSTIKAEFGYNDKGLTHSIKCQFNKLLSWGKIKNDYILNHEQGHFDITEAHARLLHKNLIEYVFNSKTVGDDIGKIHKATMKEHVEMQKQYDLLTNHSLDSAEQKKWDKKIAALLEGLKEYSDYK
jgi:predicted secreted Zn-dependent protease